MGKTKAAGKAPGGKNPTFGPGAKGKGVPKKKIGGVNKAANNLKAKLQQKKGNAMKIAGNVQRQMPKAAPKPGGRHTLLLKQDTAAASSKYWADYTSVNDAVDGFIASYEAKLRNLNPGQQKLTYSAADLQKYVDSMHDVSMLVSDPQTKQYAPKGKAFIKSAIMSRLKASVV